MHSRVLRMRMSWCCCHLSYLLLKDSKAHFIYSKYFTLLKSFFWKCHPSSNHNAYSLQFKTKNIYQSKNRHSFKVAWHSVHLWLCHNTFAVFFFFTTNETEKRSNKNYEDSRWSDKVSKLTRILSDNKEDHHHQQSSITIIILLLVHSSFV